MQAIEFPQQTDILAKNQPQYLPLPVFIKYEQVTVPGVDGHPIINPDGSLMTMPVAMEMTCCFKLSPEEIAQVIMTGKLWYTQCVFGQPFQPARMSMVNPFKPEMHAIRDNSAGWPESAAKVLKTALTELAVGHIETESGMQEQQHKIDDILRIIDANFVPMR